MVAGDLQKGNQKERLRDGGRAVQKVLETGKQSTAR